MNFLVKLSEKVCLHSDALLYIYLIPDVQTYMGLQMHSSSDEAQAEKHIAHTQRHTPTSHSLWKSHQTSLFLTKVEEGGKEGVSGP